ncbi:uncharacterized protein LOC120346968 isoform X2 [Styela clava]
MVCDDQPTWRELTKGQCTKEEEKALEVLTEQLDGIKSELYQLRKVMEKSETNSVVGVKETTTFQGYKDKTTSSVRTFTVPATFPWSTKETFLSTVRPQTTKVEQSTGYEDKKTSSARTSTVPASSPWSTDEAFLSTVRPQTTEVEQSTVCGFVYNSKCFRAIVYLDNNVTLGVAESLCKNKLANIYDITHYNLLRDYLRPMIPERLPWISVRTGMTYNHKNGQLYSTTGQATYLPNKVWFPNFPSLDASETRIVFAVNVNPEFKYQGICTATPFTLYHGAICENEL